MTVIGGPDVVDHSHHHAWMARSSDGTVTPFARCCCGVRFQDWWVPNVVVKSVRLSPSEDE